MLVGRMEKSPTSSIVLFERARLWPS